MNFENWRALASSHEKAGDITMHYSGSIDVCVRQVTLGDKQLLRFVGGSQEQPGDSFREP